jgi:hypothetical protein
VEIDRHVMARVRLPLLVDPPARVEIVGSLLDVDGNELSGLVSLQVTIGAVDGPSLVFACRLLNPGDSGGNIQLVRQGGVTGPNNGDAGEADRLAIRIIDGAGVEHTPASRLGFGKDLSRESQRSWRGGLGQLVADLAHRGRAIGW